MVGRLRFVCAMHICRYRMAVRYWYWLIASRILKANCMDDWYAGLWWARSLGGRAVLDTGMHRRVVPKRCARRLRPR